MSLADDLAEGIVTTLQAANFSSDWNFDAATAEKAGEFSESTQNVALVTLDTVRRVGGAYEASAHRTFSYKVIMSILDQYDSDTNRSKLADAIVETLDDNGDTLYGNVTDNGSNLLDAALEVSASSLVFIEEGDHRVGGESWEKPHGVIARIDVTCWHKQPLA